MHVVVVLMGKKQMGREQKERTENMAVPTTPQPLNRTFGLAKAHTPKRKATQRTHFYCRHRLALMRRQDGSVAMRS
jgi:hypothetical protein